MSTTFPRRPLALVLALAAPLGLLACSEDEPERASVRSESVAPDPSSGASGEISGGASQPAPDDPTDTTGGADTTEGDGAVESPSGGSSRDTVLGSSTGSHPANPADQTTVPLRLDVQSVTRNGEVVDVLFAVTNTDASLVYEIWSTLEGDDGQSGDDDVSGAALVDTAGGRRYLAVLDSEGTCLCTGDGSQRNVGPGMTIDLQVAITAPPAEVGEVTFTLPGFDPVTGLEIS